MGRQGGADLHEGGWQAHSVLGHHERHISIWLELKVPRLSHHTLHLLQHPPAKHTVSQRQKHATPQLASRGYVPCLVGMGGPGRDIGRARLSRAMPHRSDAAGM